MKVSVPVAVGVPEIARRQTAAWSGTVIPGIAFCDIAHTMSLDTVESAVPPLADDPTGRRRRSPRPAGSGVGLSVSAGLTVML